MPTPLRQTRDAHRASGFGLVEVVVALVVASVGVITVAGVALGVGAQARLAAWDTDQALAAHNQIDALAFAGAASGTYQVALGPRVYGVSQSVSMPSPRLKHVRVTVSSVTGPAPATFETRLAKPRPPPVAP